MTEVKLTEVKRDTFNLCWYDIDGEQTINGETSSIFASMLAFDEVDARAIFFKRFPYGKILTCQKLKPSKN